MPASKIDLRFGQVWKFYSVETPLMYIGPTLRHERERYLMLVLGDEPNREQVGIWATLRTRPENWTLLEDVDAND
jgi:hypothetical protein